MTRLIRHLALPAGLLAGAIPAAAASIVATPPQYQVFPNPNQCFIANPGTKDLTVPRVELLNQNGSVLASADNLLLEAGHIENISGTGGGLTFCRAVGVSPKKIRLTHCVRSSTGAPCTAVTTGQ